MHILGIANGSPGGNSELLMKAALTAATSSSKTLTASWIHAPSVTIPPNPPPLEGSLDFSNGAMPSLRSGKASEGIIPDDRKAVLDAILDADALIFSTPVYSHAPAGTLKGVLDRIMGPFTDAAFAKRTLDARNSSGHDNNNQEGQNAIDQRILKPRVVGFMAVAGSTLPDQVSLALPQLHLLVYSIHAKVVDQEIFLGYGAPGSVVSKDDGLAIARAQQLGQNVASQLGKEFDDAEYLGPVPPGACPFCKLAKVDLFVGEGNRIGCVACGAEGYLVVDADGVIRPRWEEENSISSITMTGKQKHIDDLIKNGVREGQGLVSVENQQKIRDWREMEIPKVKLPSHKLAT
ncbi:flavoprotein [Aspergillus unguis]